MDSQIIKNIQQQTKRLLDQLQELEELKQEIDQDEYDSMKKDTLDQLEEFQNGLIEMQSGQKTYLNEIQQAQQEIQNALRSTTDTKKLKEEFNQNDCKQYREKIKQLETNFTLNKINEETFLQQKLKYLNDIHEISKHLTTEEKQFMELHTGKNNFVIASDDQINQKKSNLLDKAQQQIKQVK